MFTTPAVGTPFAGSQVPPPLSPDAPEFVASPGRLRSNSSLLKAKDSVSSMTEVQTESSEPKTPRADHAPPEKASAYMEKPESRGGSVTHQSITADSATNGVAHPADRATQPNSASGAAESLPGPIPLASKQSSQETGSGPSAMQNPAKPDNASRPPSSRSGRSGSFSSTANSSSPAGTYRRHSFPQQNGHIQQGAYPDQHFGRKGGQQLMMGGQSPQPPYFQPPYGQLFPVPLPISMPHRNGQMGASAVMYPHGHQPPFMMHQGPQWPPYQMMPMLSPEHYTSQGFPMGMPPPMHGGYYPHGYEEQYSQHLGGESAWRPPSVLDSHSGFHHGQPHASPRGLNAAAPGWTPDDRSGVSASRPSSRPSTAGGASAGPGHRRGPSVDSIPEHGRAPDGDASGHRRMPSNSSSERRKGHRRMVSLPVDFQPTVAIPAGPVEPGPDVTDEKDTRPKKKGHRRQFSLPTASDMEKRLKEGGRKGRHSRSDSWFSTGRSSAVLEEFKNSKDGERQWTLVDVKGHIIEFCKDQTGSRFIQQALDKDATPEQVKDVALEAKPRFAMLMEDVFGNYVVQKLLERASLEERRWMAERICNDSQKPNQQNRAVALSKHSYGCRVVQKALEMLELEDKKRIMEQLLESTLDLVADQNGNHVIQKCIEFIKPTVHIGPLINELLSGKDSKSIPTLRGEVVTLSQHTYGCRVVQRVLEHCDEQAFKDRFMVEILKQVHALSTNIYSNYVIQHVLEFGLPSEKERVLGDLSHHMVALSRDKFASNVVERCLQFGSPDQRRSIIEEFLQNDAALVQMMKDDYGNYVCFRAFDLAEEDQKQRLAEVIKKSVPAVRRTSFGKNFHTRLVDHHPTYFQNDLGVHAAQVPKQLVPPRQQTVQQAGRQRTPASRAQLLAVPVLPSTSAHQEATPTSAPKRLLTTAPQAQQPASAPEAASKHQVAEAVSSLKADEPGKALPGQVSVTADGAHPPVHPPVPVRAAAEARRSNEVQEVDVEGESSERDAGQASPSQAASQEGPLTGSHVPVMIEG